MCLVPLSDMINTDMQHVNVACQTGSQGYGMSSVFVCTAAADIEAGGELLAEYTSTNSSRASGKLLINYGFVPETNPYNALEIPVSGEHDTNMTATSHTYIHT